jgi:hypothetical protein
MVFDPKGLKFVEDGEDEDEVLSCRFCGRPAALNRGDREKRI